jgi:hypothetical protein
MAQLNSMLMQVRAVLGSGENCVNQYVNLWRAVLSRMLIQIRAVLNSVLTEVKTMLISILTVDCWTKQYLNVGQSCAEQ